MSSTTTTTSFYPLPEAAEILGVCRQRVWQLCNEMELGDWFGNQIFVTEGEIEVMRQRPDRRRKDS